MALAFFSRVVVSFSFFAFLQRYFAYESASIRRISRPSVGIMDMRGRRNIYMYTHITRMRSRHRAATKSSILAGRGETSRNYVGLFEFINCAISMNSCANSALIESSPG